MLVGIGNGTSIRLDRFLLSLFVCQRARVMGVKDAVDDVVLNVY